jgi:hypothetical protein
LATDKQVTYAMSLMRKAGYGTRFMSSEHKKLGASMRERSGTVENWIKAMPVATASALIEQLKQEVPDEKA